MLKWKLRRIAKAYIQVLNDIELARISVSESKEEQNVDFEQALKLNQILIELANIQNVITNIGNTMHGFQLYKEESTQE